MRVLTELNKLGGVAARRDLFARRVSREEIVRAWQTGAIRRISRGWYAVPDARPDLIAAARTGGRLACISAAAARSLWVLTDGKLHVAGRTHHSTLDTDDRFVVHTNRKPLDQLDLPAVESIRNMLLHVARCQPIERALTVFDSALNKRLITREELQRIARMRGGRFATAVVLADGRADSGLESLTRFRLSLRGIHCRLQVRIDGHRVDILIGDRLVIQLDGFAFHDKDQRAKDLAQDRRLVLMGYTVLRFDYDAIVYRWAECENQILGAMAQGLHVAR